MILVFLGVMILCKQEYKLLQWIQYNFNSLTILIVETSETAVYSKQYKSRLLRIAFTYNRCLLLVSLYEKL